MEISGLASVHLLAPPSQTHQFLCSSPPNSGMTSFRLSEFLKREWILFFLAKAGLHGLVKDLIKHRQQDDDKAEKLLIDSILDYDFMDEEKVW